MVGGREGVAPGAMRTMRGGGVLSVTTGRRRCGVLAASARGADDGRQVPGGASLRPSASLRSGHEVPHEQRNQTNTRWTARPGSSGRRVAALSSRAQCPQFADQTFCVEAWEARRATFRADAFVFGIGSSSARVRPPRWCGARPQCAALRLRVKDWDRRGVALSAASRPTDGLRRAACRCRGRSRSCGLSRCPSRRCRASG